MQKLRQYVTKVALLAAPAAILLIEAAPFRRN